MSNYSIGEKLKKYRTMKGYTQADLARALSEFVGKTIAPSAIAGYENGQRVPKVEVRNQIAAILEVDPIEMSGIEMTEMDEKRLICKLLAKYAIAINLNEDGTVVVGLPDDFAGFQMEYEFNREMLEFNIDGQEEASLEYEVTKQSAEDELDYWLEMYPSYDPVYLCKKNKGVCTLKEIMSLREKGERELRENFYKFQDEYLDQLNERKIREKIRKKLDDKDNKFTISKKAID